MSRDLTTARFHDRTARRQSDGASVRIPGTTSELIKHMLERLGSKQPHLPASAMHDEAARSAYAYQCGEWDAWVGLERAWTDQQEQLSHGSVRQPT